VHRPAHRWGRCGVVRAQPKARKVHCSHTPRVIIVPRRVQDADLALVRAPRRAFYAQLDVKGKYWE
jgi:hypothetical protein